MQLLLREVTISGITPRSLPCKKLSDIKPRKRGLLISANGKKNWHIPSL